MADDDRKMLNAAVWCPETGIWKPQGGFWPADFTPSILPTPKYAPGDLVDLRRPKYSTRARIKKATLSLCWEPKPGESTNEVVLAWLDRLTELAAKRGEVDASRSGRICYIVLSFGHLHHVYNEGILGLSTTVAAEPDGKLAEHLAHCDRCARSDVYGGCDSYKILSARSYE